MRGKVSVCSLHARAAVCCVVSNEDSRDGARVLTLAGYAWLQCPQCGHWRTAWHGRVCTQCHNDASHAPIAVAPPHPPAHPPPHDASLFGAHTTHGRTTLIQRAACVVLAAEGRTRQEIGTLAGVSQPTVRHWIAHYDEHKNLNEQKHGGQRVTDEALDTAIAGASHLDPFASPRGIKRALNLDVSENTIRRRLDEAGLHARVARHQFLLTDEHKRKRLSFAEGYSRWSEDDWCTVIFADESTFLGAGYHGRAYVRREDGTADALEHVLSKRPHPVSVPAWGCFSSKGPGYMQMYEGSLAASQYRDILRDYLLPTAEEHFGEGRDWWLLHDNDPGRHMSQVVKTWIHNNAVHVLEFPPYSPDLNPIENLWANVKKKMENSQAATKDELEELLTETWAEVTQEECEKLARSMCTRIQQCIARRGAYTDH